MELGLKEVVSLWKQEKKKWEFMNIIEWRTKISIQHINYMMKIYWSAVNMETKAESSF